MSKKLKIGDLVTVTNNPNRPYELPKDKIYVVRYLPKQTHKENTYSLISNYYEGVCTYDWNDKDIKRYNKKVPFSSAIGTLQRIIKNDIDVNKEVWEGLLNGSITLDDRTSFRDVYNLQEGDTWGFFVNTLTTRYTGLPVDLYVSCIELNHTIDDYVYKIRVQNGKRDVAGNNGFYLTLEEQPQIIIGKSNLPKEDFEKVYSFISKNYQKLIKAADEKWDYEELTENLGNKK